jgi:hypothetical protein
VLRFSEFQYTVQGAGMRVLGAKSGIQGSGFRV